MKKIITLTIFVLTGLYMQAQVSKAVLAEHFTNTVCPICASKNPALYQNLANHPDVMHIAYHPSAPYPSCIFSMQNPAENDGRTNYYGVYGSTPRLVINGEVQPVSVNFGDPNLFTAFAGGMTPISIKIKEHRYSPENFSIEVTVKAVSPNSTEQALIFVGYVEDTVPYTSPNGETTHTDVFRKALTNVDGDMIILPAQGDSITMSYDVAPEDIWNIDNMYTLAIIQKQDSKELIQAAKTSEIDTMNPNAVEALQQPLSRIQAYPNPAQNIVNIENAKNDIYLLSLDGRTLRKVTPVKDQKTAIDVSGLSDGMYILRSGTASSVLSVVR